MEKKTKWFIIIAISINIILCLVWIAHSQLTRIAADFTIPDLNGNEYEQTGTAGSSTGSSNGNRTTVDPADPYKTGSSAKTRTQTGLTGEQARVAGDVQAKVNKPISSRDMLRAGLILWGNLPREEFKYVYAVGRKDNATADELQKVRDILLTRLTEEDLNDLKTLGFTYGKSLKILDPTVPIKTTPPTAEVD